MRNETVRRVYLGGSIETAARPESTFRDADDAVSRGRQSSASTTARRRRCENVSIHVHEGEFVSVVGLNGAGKTTLFNAISGLVPYAGDIRREGETLRGSSRGGDRPRRHRAMPRRPRTVQRHDGARESRSRRPASCRQPRARRQLAWLFDLFPILRERQRQAAGTLSGGEQQMLTIARALMMKPKLLILDEPTLGLGAGHPRTAVEGAGKLAADHRRSRVLLGEQNVTFALPHADRVYVLEHARIVWEGEPGPLRRRSGHRIFIGRSSWTSSRLSRADNPKRRLSTQQRTLPGYCRCLLDRPMQTRHQGRCRSWWNVLRYSIGPSGELATFQSF